MVYNAKEKGRFFLRFNDNMYTNHFYLDNIYL